MRSVPFKLLITAFSLVCMAVGTVLIFLPDELAPRLYSPSPPPFLLELPGAALFGFGVMNWISRHATLGGIYGRPLIVGNLAHFVIGGLPLAKVATTANAAGPALWPLASVYLAGALLYGLLLFRNPVRGAGEPGMR